MDSFDVGYYVSKALDSPELYDKANQEAGLLVSKFRFQPSERDYIRVSDVGRCTRELQASMRGELDIPKDFFSELTRFYLGSSYGAGLAALFKAAYLDENPNDQVLLEETTDTEEPGHIDIWIPGQRVIDVKTTGQVKPLEPASWFNRVQTAKYAIAKNERRFSVFTVGYAVWKKNRFDGTTRGRFERTDNFETADYVDKVAEEYERLKLALLPEQAPENPKEAYRCEYCRVSACLRNINPLKDLAVPAGM